MQTGRRDGLISSAQSANASVPAPTVSLYQAIPMFLNKGLSPIDMVVLLGMT